MHLCPCCLAPLPFFCDLQGRKKMDHMLQHMMNFQLSRAFNSWLAYHRGCMAVGACACALAQLYLPPLPEVTWQRHDSWPVHAAALHVPCLNKQRRRMPPHACIYACRRRVRTSTTGAACWTWRGLHGAT